jgi:hypothetical protein
VAKAEIKPQKLLRFLELNKTGELSAGSRVAVVGSALAGNEGAARGMTITSRSSDRLEIAGATAASSVGAPVVNENGDVVGVVTSGGEKTIARPVAALDSVLSRVTLVGRKLPKRARHRARRRSRECSMRLRHRFLRGSLCPANREQANIG